MRFCDALAQTLKTSGMLYVVIIGALIFAVFMSFTGLAEQIAALVHGMHGGPTADASSRSPCCCCCWVRCSTDLR